MITYVIVYADTADVHSQKHYGLKATEKNLALKITRLQQLGRIIVSVRTEHA